MVPAAIAPTLEVPVDAGELDDATTDGAAEATELAEAAEVGASEATGLVAAWEVADATGEESAVVTKTPPETDGAAADADVARVVGVLVTDADEAGLEVAEEGALDAPEAPEVEAPDDAADPPPIPLTAAQVPVNEPELSVTVSFLTTLGPGFGKSTSFPSTLVQPFARLATKRSGRLEKGVDDAARFDAPVMVTDAQFW